MKRKASLLLLAVCLAFAAPALADEVLLNFTGFDYEDSDPSSTYLEVGEGYKALGFVTSVGPLLDPYVDFTANQYTWYLFDLTVSQRFFVHNILQAVFTNDGRGRYFEDSRTTGTDATNGYGLDPLDPGNTTAPEYFVDGTLKLGGDVDEFVLIYDFNANRNTGEFSGNMTQDEGSALIYIPPSQRSGWLLGGIAGRPNGTIPGPGWDNQVSGQCRIPDASPATHETWGALKALYR